MKNIYILCMFLFALNFSQTNAEVPFLGNTPNEVKKSVHSYQVLAKNNDVKAQYYLGCMYFNGEGVVQSDNEAVKWWLKAAEQGHPRSMNNIASMYYEGRGGLNEDRKLAYSWWIMSAEKGDNYAISNIGLENSQNLTEDLKQLKEKLNIK